LIKNCLYWFKIVIFLLSLGNVELNSFIFVVILLLNNWFLLNLLDLELKSLLLLLEV
jgi:hypothetical protein